MKDTSLLQVSLRFSISLLVADAEITGCALLARQARPSTTFRDCDGCPEMVVIPAGAFVMGDSL
jgi:hypothetical protein